MPCSLLVVEDEKAFLPLLKRYRERAGHTETACLDAESALQIADTPGWCADVLVADLTLPGRSGLELSTELLRRHPALLALLCSGYPLQTEMLPADLRPRIGLLPKPFLPTMLADAISALRRQTSPVSPP